MATATLTEQRLLAADGRVLAATVEPARTPWRRFCGLMMRAELPQGHALWIEPCSSIHTFFMRFPIDVALVDRDGTVLRTYAALRPWRATRVVRRARSTVELPAGTLATAGVRAGDRLRLG